MAHDDWAIAVGINCYSGAGINQLEGAAADAQRFYDWLSDPMGGDVPERNRKLLVSPPARDDPTMPSPIRWQIIKWFEELVEGLIQRGRPGRRLYIYLSGHGIVPATAPEQTSLLMANAIDPRLLLNFGGSVWAQGARSGAWFQEVVLVMDCCRDLKSNASLDFHIFGDAVPDAEGCHMLAALATNWNSKARELVFEGENDGRKQGAFTRSLLAVLRSGRMSGALLRDSVREHLAMSLKGQWREQRPQFLAFPDPERSHAALIFNEAAPLPRTPVAVIDPANARILEVSRYVEYKPTVVQGWQDDDRRPIRGHLAPGNYRILDAAERRRECVFTVFAGVPCTVDMPV